MIALALRGKTNKSIAKALSVTKETVKTHIKHVYKKTSVHNRAELSLLFKVADPE